MVYNIYGIYGAESMHWICRAFRNPIRNAIAATASPQRHRRKGIAATASPQRHRRKGIAAKASHCAVPPQSLALFAALGGGGGLRKALRVKI